MSSRRHDDLLVNSLGNVVLHVVKAGSNDLEDLLDDLDFLGTGSLLGVVAGLAFVALFDELGLAGGGDLEFLLVVGETDFLGVEVLTCGFELLLNLGKGVLEVGSFLIEFTDHLVEVSLGISLSLDIVFDGSGNGFLELVEVLDDALECTGVEGHGDLEEGTNWVGATDLSELNESSVDVTVWFKVFEFWGDLLEGIDDSALLGNTVGEVSLVFLAGLTELDFLVTEELDLGFIGFLLGLEGGNLTLVVGDGDDGLVDFVGGLVNSGVVVLDLFNAVTGGLGFFGIGLLLLVEEFGADV